MLYWIHFERAVQLQEGPLSERKHFLFLQLQDHNNDESNNEMFVLNRENIFFNCRVWGMLLGMIFNIRLNGLYKYIMLRS